MTLADLATLRALYAADVLFWVSSFGAFALRRAVPLVGRLSSYGRLAGVRGAALREQLAWCGAYLLALLLALASAYVRPLPSGARHVQLALATHAARRAVECAVVHRWTPGRCVNAAQLLWMFGFYG